MEVWIIKEFQYFLGLEDHDEEGNVIITNQEEALRSALVCSGKREPDLSGGLSMGFQYKISVLIQRSLFSLEVKFV